jgi:voltage-gated potassium channel
VRRRADEPGASRTRIPHPADSTLPRITGRIVAALLVVLVVLAVATAGFHRAGGGSADWADSLYMALITISTVGYGEAVPLDSTGDRVFAGVAAIVGFGALTFLFTSLSVFFLEKDLDHTLRRRRMEKKIRKLRGHYIVCGFGRVGRNTARELASTGRDFVAIDTEPARFDAHREEFPGLLFLHGDASDDALLLAADLGDAAGVFAVTGDDSRNLMITITAKQLNPRARVVARAHEVRNIDKIRRAGADDVISPDFTGGLRIASAMLRPHVVNLLDEMMRSDQALRVEEFPVAAGFAPVPLAALELLRRDFLLISVRTPAGWVFNPEPEFRIEPGHVLVAMASATGRAAIEQRLASLGG